MTGIKFFSQPQATLSPMDKADHRALLMEGFRWENNRRPLSVDDLFKKQERKPVAVALPDKNEEAVLDEDVEIIENDGALKEKIEKVEGGISNKKSLSKKKKGKE